MSTPQPFLNRPHAGTATQPAVDEGLQSFFAGTYRHMTVAMIITGIIAYIFGQDLLALTSGRPTAFVPQDLLLALFTTPLRWLVILGPLAFVLISSALMHRMSPGAARTCLYAFAAMMGLSVSTIFVRYTGISIAQTFFATAAAFAGLSLYGYTTKRDLGPIGRFMFMGLIGLVILGLLNLFIQSEPMSLALSAVAIFVFAGLTAYDTQKLKNSFLEMRAAGGQADDIARLSIIGALELYLDALNLFLALLRFMGASNSD